MANRTIIFDYDGTIHNCTIVYKTAFLKVYDQLVADGFAQPKVFTDSEINHWLGYNTADAWNLFMPQLSEEQKGYYSKLLGEYMYVAFEEGKARWYPHALEVIQQLKTEGYPMVLLSNCGIRYMEMHNAIFGLKDLFVGLYPCEKYNYIPKYQVFTYIQQDHPGEYVVVGDRFHDMELAKYHGLPFVGCLYGYGADGELDGADYCIQDILELPAVLRKIV